MGRPRKDDIMRRTTLLLTVLALVAGAALTRAQVDPSGRIYLYQEGNRVGEVFVEEGRVPLTTLDDRTEYREHWVLYPKYRYVGPNYLRGLVIKAEPSAMPYTDLADFQRRVPFGPKYKYIQITATEQLISLLPGATTGR